MNNEIIFCKDLTELQCRASTVLVVEDEPLTRLKIGKTLSRSHFETLEAGSGEEALERIHSRHIDLVLLDIMLPGLDGFEVCRSIRSEGRDTPVIMLTQLDAKVDIIRGLVMGADDYIVKPFVPEELVARIKAVLRRSRESTGAGSTIKYRDLTIEFQAQRCFRGDQELDLTPKEFALLTALCCHTGQAVSRSKLVQQVWGENHYVSDKSLDVYVGRLRQKIEENPAEPAMIRTVRGFGYVCEP
jgi:two-component system alkaline phosphatase synthesis response regulator PhoP